MVHRSLALDVAVLVATQQSFSAAADETRTTMTAAWKRRSQSSAHGLVASTLAQQTAHTVCRLATHQFLIDHDVAVSWRDWVRDLACDEVVKQEPLPPTPSPHVPQSLFARAVERVRGAGLQKWSSQQLIPEEAESTAITTITTLPLFL
jgi:hypothetical protein